MLINRLTSLHFGCLSVLLVSLAPSVSAQAPEKEDQFGSRLKENPGGNTVKRIGRRIETRINNRIERTSAKSLNLIYAVDQKIESQSTLGKSSEAVGNAR